MCLRTTRTQWNRSKVSAGLLVWKGEGPVKRLMMRVVFQREHQFSGRHTYTDAGDSDGVFTTWLTQEKEVMPAPLGGSGLGGPGSEASHPLTQVPTVLSLAQSRLHFNSLVSK